MPLDLYTEALHRLHQTGQAREHAYRPALVNLLEEYLPEANIVNDPARTRAGAPDLLFQRRQIAVGYLETKDLGTDLDAFEHSDQFGRYLNAFSNLITTNYEEFRWYREHQVSPIRVVHIGAVDAPFALQNLAQDFFDWNSAQIDNEEELARQLARAARTFQALIGEALREGIWLKQNAPNVRANVTLLLYGPIKKSWGFKPA
jgi:hypothetical protein